MIIEHKGEVLDTKHYYELTDEECEQIRNEILEKPNREKVLENLGKMANGGIRHSDTTNYYFIDLMNDVRLYHSKWSVSDAIYHNDLLRVFYSKTLKNKSIFPDTHSKAKKIQTSMRLGGKGIASKPTNFPMKTVDQVLEKYNVNNNYIDPSCGWGVRALSALRNNVNYYGIDPNDKLINQINNMISDYKKVDKSSESTTDIRCQGSETLVKGWVGKMGLAFTSPPYYNLEDYKHGNQSYKEGVTYSEWLDNYLEPTISNIHKYLIKDGYAIFNVNNFKEYKIVEDTMELFLKYGFKYIETLTLKNIQRINTNDNSESVLVFQKEM